MTRLVSLILIAILLLSCKESEQNKIARLVNEWNGKIIQFPDSMCLTSYRNDTAIVKYTRDDANPGDNRSNTAGNQQRESAAMFTS